MRRAATIGAPPWQGRRRDTFAGLRGHLRRRIRLHAAWGTRRARKWKALWNFVKMIRKFVEAPGVEPLTRRSESLWHSADLRPILRIWRMFGSPAPSVSLRSNPSNSDGSDKELTTDRIDRCPGLRSCLQLRQPRQHASRLALTLQIPRCAPGLPRRPPGLLPIVEAAVAVGLDRSYAYRLLGKGLLTTA